MANTLTSGSYNAEDFAAALSAKLFFEFTPSSGSLTSQDKTELNSAAAENGALHNTLIFVPSTNELMVNGTWYGASTEFRANIVKTMVKLFGDSVANGELSLNEAITKIEGMVADLVKQQAIYYGLKAVDAHAITSDSNVADKGYVEVTELEDVKEGSNYNADIDGTEILKRITKVNIPLDGNTIFNIKNKLSSVYKMEVIPADTKIYVNSVSDENEIGAADNDKVRLVLFVDNSLDKSLTVDKGLNKQWIVPNYVSYVDASAFVLDEIIGIDTVPGNNHAVKFTDKLGKEVVLDLSDLVDVKEIESVSLNYLTFTPSYDEDKDGTHVIKYTAKILTVTEDELEDIVKDGIVFKPINKVEGNEDENIDNYVIDDSTNSGANPFTPALVDSETLAIALKKRDLAEAAKFANLQADHEEMVERDIDAAFKLIAGEAKDGKGGLIQDLRQEVNDTIDGLNTNPATGVVGEAGSYGSVTVKQEKGIVTGVTTELKVKKIMDLESGGEIDLNNDQLSGNLADAGDVAQLVAAVQSTLESYINTRDLAILTQVNDWVNNGAWGKIEGLGNMPKN